MNVEDMIALRGTFFSSLDDRRAKTLLNSYVSEYLSGASDIFPGSSLVAYPYR
jgi:hypothetical protein